MGVKLGEHLACMGEVHTVFVGDLTERDHLEDLGIYGRKPLKCIFKLVGEA
jgi:hypothetical protein